LRRNPAAGDYRRILDRFLLTKVTGTFKIQASVILRFHFPVDSGVSTAVDVRFRCPCCGYKTLDAPGALQLCPVCWWEDDGQEDNDASEVRLTVNGQLSLNEARAHFAQFGASHPRFLPYVRKPLAVER
jgi:hypothetical protein